MSGDDRDSEWREVVEQHGARALELKAVAADPNLSEDNALALLESRDLPPGVLDELARNRQAMKRRKVRLALVCHPQTPRFISLPLMRQLYTFELTRVAVMPAAAADLKIAAENALIARLATLSTGERLALARQGTTRVAAELLNDAEMRVMGVALENPRLTEAALIKVITSGKARPELVQAVCTHAKWSLRREVRVALLRNENTPLAKAIQFANELPVDSVREVLQASQLPENVRKYLVELVRRR